MEDGLIIIAFKDVIQFILTRHTMYFIALIPFEIFGLEHNAIIIIVMRSVVGTFESFFFAVCVCVCFFMFYMYINIFS